MSPTVAKPDTLVQLDPSSILMQDNARYTSEVPADEAAQMCASILEVGRIMEPVGVTVLNPPINGYGYLLRYGFRRVAGALLANQQGSGVMVPALVLHDADAVDTLREQVTENVIRKSLSLMDTATAARKMLDAGMSRKDVCAAFTRPAGTKGGGVAPASNAWLNMVLGLLELPVSIQKRIHNGDIGIAAAYRIMKSPPDKRQAILEAAEKIQADIRATEDKEEAAYAALETKIVEATKGAEEATTEVEQLQAAAEVSQKAVEEKIKAAEALYAKQRLAENGVKLAKKKKDAKATKEANAALKAVRESYKAAEADVKAAEKIRDEDQAKLDKATKTQSKFADAAKSLREKLEAKQAAAQKPRKAAKPSDGKISPKAVEQAAKEQGVETGKKKLSGPEMRKFIEELAAVRTYPKVAAIGAAILACFNSDNTYGETIKALAAIVGETKATAKK